MRLAGAISTLPGAFGRSARRTTIPVRPAPALAPILLAPIRLVQARLALTLLAPVLLALALAGCDEAAPPAPDPVATTAS